MSTKDKLDIAIDELCKLMVKESEWGCFEMRKVINMKLQFARRKEIGQKKIGFGTQEEYRQKLHPCNIRKVDKLDREL
jgi:hypothetical protein